MLPKGLLRTVKDKVNEYIKLKEQLDKLKIELDDHFAPIIRKYLYSQSRYDLEEIDDYYISYVKGLRVSFKTYGKWSDTDNLSVDYMLNDGWLAALDCYCNEVDEMVAKAKLKGKEEKIAKLKKELEDLEK